MGRVSPVISECVSSRSLAVRLASPVSIMFGRPHGATPASAFVNAGGGPCRAERCCVRLRRPADRRSTPDGALCAPATPRRWRTAPAVGRTVSHPPAPPTGRAQEIPNAQARAEIPCRAGPQAQHSASHSPPERPAIHQPNRPAGRRRYKRPRPRRYHDAQARAKF